MFAPSADSQLRHVKVGPAQVRRLREVLAPLGELEGIVVAVKTAQGRTVMVSPEGILDPPDPGFVWVPVDGGGEVLIADQSESRAHGRAVETIVRLALQLFEVEKREELMLDELGASWESLDALYEISTDILRAGDINDALKRLIHRLASVQTGLRAALFVMQKGRLIPLVSPEEGAKAVEVSQLGSLAKMLTERQVIIQNHLAEPPDPDTVWRAAMRLAAAPLTSEQRCIGFVVVWLEDEQFEFESPFVRLLEAITYQASMLMESDRLNRKVRASELLAQEINIASSIQQTLLLANTPRNVPGMETASCSVPSQNIDGDFHEFFQHPDGSIDVIVGDVMGKGVAAALLGAATKTQLLRSVANLALRAGKGAPRPADVIKRAASRIEEQLVQLERFVTLYYARFDATAKQLYFVDCGHTATILNRKANGDCIFLQGDDLPLGVMHDFTCQQHSIAFQPGDTFLFYSDGVTENRSPTGEFFGAGRLAECVQTWSSLGPAVLVEQIRKEALRFNGSQRFSDDFTCVAVRIRIAPEMEKPVAERTEIFPSDTQALPAFRNWLRESAGLTEDPLGEEAISRMELACTELFVNCATHGTLASEPQPIQVTSLMYRNHITTQIRHKGPEFDLLSIPPPYFDGSKEFGFGIYIVLRSADEAAYQREPDGTNITTVSFMRLTTEQTPCK
jgi:phosphoserine phosphatase RsbU/P